MNIKDYEKAVATVEREVELMTPTGKPTGWFWTLRHDSAKEVQEFMRVYRGKVQELALKRKASAQKKLLADHEDRLRIVQTAGWRWKEGDDDTKGRPKFSKKELREVLDNEKINYHIRQFIDDEVGSLEDFLERLQDS